MIIKTIASSSSGNCTMVSSGDTHILIDCGLSAKRTIEGAGRDEFDAVILTHEHSDHFKGAGPVGRKTKAPMYMHELCFKAKEDQLKKCDIILVEAGDVLDFGDIIVTLFSTRHDSRYSFGLILEERETEKKFVYVTDTGCVPKPMLEHIKVADALFIEADYDVKSLEEFEGYDDFLKERISSNNGHLSNDQTADVLRALDKEKLQFVVFGHLSPRTNTPELVLEMAKGVWEDYENFYVAPHDEELIML